MVQLIKTVSHNELCRGKKKVPLKLNLPLEQTTDDGQN